MSFIDSISAYKASIAFSKKNYDKAIKIYEKLVAKPNPNPAYIIKYAYVSIYLGKIDLCKSLLDKVNYDDLKDDFLISAYKQTEGLYIWKTGNLDAAIDIYRDLHNKYRNTSIYETLGYLLIVSKRYTEALQYNIEAYDYSNDNNVIIDNLAETYFFLKQYGRAKELYLKIHDENNPKKPTFSEAYYYYALILKEEGKFDKAKEYLEKALTYRESNLSILKHDEIRKELNSL